MGVRSNRRRFMQTTAAVVGSGYLIGNSLQAADSNSPNEKIRFASIGVGGKGQSDSDDAAKNGDMVAICDVDENTLAKAGEKWPNAKRYTDFRKMFDEMAGSIDAVTVSTPDHTHAVAAAMAMRLGKHCFCQKPLTKTIAEARMLGDIAREKKVATQMGNQGTANASLRKAAAVVRSGAIGNVKELHVWTNRPIWPQGGPRPESTDVPKHVNWEAWLGPAPYRPFANGYHPFAWRGYWDFGTGALGDMACHTMNMPFMALDLRDPIAVSAESSPHNKDSFPAWSIIKYEFDKNDWRPGCNMFWYDGGKKVNPDLLDGQPLSNTGVLIIGDKGKLFAPGDYCENGHKLLGGVEEPEVEFEKSPGHFEEYVRAIKGGPAARSNFPDYAGPLSETVLLGNLAVWAGNGVRVEWDAKNMNPKNCPDAMPLVKYNYRDGYTL